MTHDVCGEFFGLMDRLGPFEPRPRVAVGVSGGPDSLALCLLLKAWTDRAGGALLALTVDHGLRHNAADEAVRVGSWLAARGIAHDVLRWEGDKPVSGIQAAARDARHRLLADRCRSEGILHLALAHHLEDQAETILLRFAKGSGPDGLAGMSPLRETGAVRILRPLLGMPRARLKAVLEAAGQPWIEDPSNRSAAYARVRLRTMADTLAKEGWTPAHAAETARRAGRTRSALEVATAQLLARAVEVWPEGCVLLRPEPIRAAPDDLALRVLGRCLASVGGARYQPRRDAVERFHRSFSGGAPPRGATLGGCRIMPRQDGRLLVAREPRSAVERIAIRGGATLRWDGRFLVTAPSGAGGVVAPLGAASCAGALPKHLERLPAVVRETLPVLLREGGAKSFPRFDFANGINPEEEAGTASAIRAVFAPPEPVAASAFVVV
ncbi:tRNA lysidine(34) synthetase TilS [Skermanella mucosa]|uniref:tRNA lysidine(34) synthetase TilS n=1 Tax=Skermanella mucosa TaxID=1789672 RepID=UPI00192AB0B6|nr:tRNA lysidine(34) synthetase TilS [Skermanella mucosa]UEM23197.1 tRNA lysidine(34) synthetase TilS [Skermanella mucosa]